MPKSLLIVESPTKAKTLERYLGKQFIVRASVGHVKDLPKSKLGIDLEKQFEPEYQVIRGKKKIINELNEAAAQADAIFLGPDPDREGEAIAWHIAEELKTGKKPVYRVLFYELTKKAIEAALAKPTPLNKSLYEAQQARRILDRLVGYQISPILWDKVKRGLSAGRVQSVALRLLCSREDEVRAFDSEEYWTISAKLLPLSADAAKTEAKPFSAQLSKFKNKKVTIGSGDEASTHVEALKPLAYTVASVERKKRKRNPSPPFITSTLQQEAARKLHFSARQTMSVAQKLYEGLELGDEGAVGLITYMRTDSTRLSQDAVEAVRQFISDKWGKEYLPARATVYKTRAGAQDAHEAVRPSDVHRTPEAVAPYLKKEQLSLYTLIWKRFVACQMSPAVIAQTAVDVAAGEYTLRATGSVVEFPGFMSLYVEGKDNPEGGEEGEGWLPELNEGQSLDPLEIIPDQHFTQPPPRYSEASLIKELEERGIGRPSTYATILSTIVEREYATLLRQKLFPTELGYLIDQLMVQHFPNIVDADFTAKMEKGLDEVERGSSAWLSLLEDFYGPFAMTLESAQANMVNLKVTGWPTDLTCPTCSRPLSIRWSRNGPFLACSGYPECKFSSDYQRDEKGGIHIREEQPTGEICDKCGKPMVKKRGRYGEFLACSGYPECKTTRAPSTGIPCPREGCEGELVERSGKFGRHFYGCNKYPDCKTVFWTMPVKKECPACGSPIMVEKTSKREGTKLVCANPACTYEEKAPAGESGDDTSE